MDRIFGIGDGLDWIRIGIVGASAVASLAYLRFAGQAPSPGRAILKTFCFSILAVLPLTYAQVPAIQASGFLLLSSALALSALGDYLLAATDQDRYFVPGLVSFLLAHVVFVLTFLPLAGPPDMVQWLVMAAALGASGLLLMQLLPRLGRLLIPVISYFTVINTMVCVAVAASGAGWLLAGGAILFAVSDSMIAIRKFLTPFRGIHEAVWLTYAAAQLMICLSVLAALLTPR